MSARRGATAIAAALAAFGAAAAHGQSNVAIYGIVDAYLQHLDAAERLRRVQSGGLQASRLGFRGGG